MYVLGFSVGHDKGAVLIKDGEVVVGITEERITRVKHDGAYNPDIPRLSMEYCIKSHIYKNSCSFFGCQLRDSSFTFTKN